jgi:hypothetical protein
VIPLVDRLDTPIVTECVLCSKLLGHDSREQGWITCPAHRSCGSCGTRVAMPEDLRLRYNDIRDRGSELTEDSLLIHPRCLMLRATQDATSFPVTVSQSHYDLLNKARLSGHPDLTQSLQDNIDQAKDASSWWLSTMTFEEKLRHIQIMEAVLAQTLIASRVTKIEVKLVADKIATAKKEKITKAQRQLLAATQSNGTTPQTEREISRPQYMDLLRWKDSYPKQWIALSKTQQDQMKARERGIASYMKALQLDRTVATDMVDGTNPLPWISGN